MSKVVNCHRAETLKIHNPNDDGNPLSVQLPADMVFCADTVLRQMCMRGAEAPDLIMRRTVGGTGSTMWLARFGGYSGSGVTPWAAMADLGHKLEAN
jgi:hypothetical protein